MFRQHDSLNLPTYVYVSFEQRNERTFEFHLPVAFNLGDPTLERISVKKMRCVESGYQYPHIDLVFIRGGISITRTASSKMDDNCGFYKSVQTISKYADESPNDSTENTLNGYLFFAFKTMEDMHTRKFTESWKTWSGARMLCTTMPPPHCVTKLSFFRRVSGQTGFEYILIAKVKNMMANAAPALNVLHFMKPRICCFVGAYRRVHFEISRKICDSLGLQEANYANALTRRFRVTYSNNTGYVQLSEEIEFRCISEEEEEREKIRRASETGPQKVSVEIQTEPAARLNKIKRVLPRTDSSLPLYETSIIDSAMTSPDSNLRSVIENANKIVEVGGKYLLVLDNRDRKLIKRTNNEQTPVNNEDEINRNNQSAIIASESSPVLKDKKIILEDDGALLRRLKTQYFHSEEYTAEELCRRSPA